MLGLKQELCHADVAVCLEVIQSLIGHSEGGPSEMKSEGHFLSQSGHTAAIVFCSCQSALCARLGEHEKGAKLAAERGDACEKGLPGHAQIMAGALSRGALLCAMARKTRKQMHTKQVKEGAQEN